MLSAPGDEQHIVFEGCSWGADTGSFADYDYIYVEPLNAKITLETPTKNEVFPRKVVTIEGKASDEITKVSISAIRNSDNKEVLKPIPEVLINNGKFKYEWNIPANTLAGKYTIKAIAKDNTGKELDSAEVEIYISSKGSDTPSKDIITRESSDFSNKIEYYDNSKIKFKCEEENLNCISLSSDHMMQSSLVDPLSRLTDLVYQEWGESGKLRITDAWDEDLEHHLHPRLSAHYEGRGLDLTTSDQDKTKYSRLGAMAIEAGFDFVFYEIDHIHVTHTGDYASTNADMIISVQSPKGRTLQSDTIVTDPDGITVSKLSIGISGARYIEKRNRPNLADINLITLPERKIGHYNIKVNGLVPVNGYNLAVSAEGKKLSFPLISGVSSQTYEIESDSTSIRTKVEMKILVHCPVDITVTDPEGFNIGKESNNILGATYTETDTEGDDILYDLITLPERKIGNYLISVIPEPDASPTDTYTLEETMGGTTVVSAKEAMISEIPAQPYIIESTETGLSSRSVNIKVKGTPLMGINTSDILKVEYTNFSLGDAYNISIIAPNGTKVYYDNGTLTRANPEIIPINWTPSSSGNHTIEAWGRGMINSTLVYLYDSEVVSPVPEFGTVVLVAAGMLGLIGIRRRY